MEPSSPSNHDPAPIRSRLLRLLRQVARGVVRDLEQSAARNVRQRQRERRVPRDREKKTIHRRGRQGRR